MRAGSSYLVPPPRFWSCSCFVAVPDASIRTILLRLRCVVFEDGYLPTVHGVVIFVAAWEKARSNEEEEAAAKENGRSRSQHDKFAACM